MTTQEAHDAQVAWFSRDGAVYGYERTPSTNEGHCVYRGNRDPDSDCRCNIGCLLPNEAYSPNFDHGGGISFGGILEEKKNKPLQDWLAGIDHATIQYLAASQDCHDMSAEAGEPISTFLERLAELRQQYV